MGELLLRFGVVNLWRILKLMKLFILLLFVEMWLGFIIENRILQVELKIFNRPWSLWDSYALCLKKLLLFWKLAEI